MNNWEMIRTEVKTLDRKVDALLASTDPGDVRGEVLYLVAAYPFHRGKLNEPRVREIIEDAIYKVTGQRVTVTTVLHDELQSVVPPTSGGGGPPPEDNGSSEPEKASIDGEDTDVTARVESGEEEVVNRLKAIFEAEEVPPDALPGGR